MKYLLIELAENINNYKVVFMSNDLKQIQEAREILKQQNLLSYYKIVEVLK